MVPHEACKRAEALRAHARETQQSSNQANPKQGLFSSLLRRFRRSA